MPDELLFVGLPQGVEGDREPAPRASPWRRAARPAITLRLLGRSPDAATEASVAGARRASSAWPMPSPSRSRSTGAGSPTRWPGPALFVHPSPRETFGVVAVEALASGLPVVATDSGGVTEILGADADRLGAIVPIDDPEALGRAIVATLERRAAFDPAELRASVERRFGSAFVAERLLVEYRELVGAAAPRGSLPAPGAPVGPKARTRRRRAGPGARGAAARPAPGPIRSRITLITAREPADTPPPAVGSVLEVDVEPAWRPKVDAPAATRRPGLAGRLARLATDPVGTVERRLGRGPGSEGSLEPAVAALREALAAPGVAGVLPLDGHDHLVAAKAGATIVAGGSVRRLADLSV